MTPSPADYGVGARISIYPMTDRFVDVILGALTEFDPRGLSIETSAVSTFVGGGEAEVLGFVADLIAGTCRRAGDAHLAAHLLLSRGCPGEVTCDLRSGPWAGPGAIHVADIGVRAAAEWSLYPFVDPGADLDHMAPISDAVAAARASGLQVESDHYVTRLRGDVGAILSVVASGWLAAGAHVQHVTSHLSLSINSPTPGAHA